MMRNAYRGIVGRFRRSRSWAAFSLLLLAVYLGAELYCVRLYDSADDFRDQVLRRGVAAELARGLESSSVPEASLSWGSFFRAAKSLVDLYPELDPYLLDSNGRVLFRLSPSARPGNSIVSLAPLQKLLGNPNSFEAPVYGEDPTDGNIRAVFSAAPISVPGFEGYIYIVLHNRTRRLLGISWLERGHWYSGIAFALFLGSCIFWLVRIFRARFRGMHHRILQLAEGEVPGRMGSGACELEPPGRAIEDLDSYERAIVKLLSQVTKERSELQGRETEVKRAISRVAHDSKTPLRLIEEYAERLISSHDALFAAEQRKDAEKIRQNVKSLLLLLSDFDEYESLVTSLCSMKRDICCLDEFAHELVSLYSLRAERSSITLRVAAPNEPLPVMANPQLLERVLKNLLDNAIRHTPAGGIVELRLLLKAANVVQVAVSDSGCGIPASELPHIFEPFRQVSEGRRANGSSGLGLAIVSEIVRSHGAEIRVESREHYGSCFSFELPLYEQQVSRDPVFRSAAVPHTAIHKV